MRNWLKDILTLLNTASLVGVIFYLCYRDHTIAVIGALAAFVACLSLFIAQRAIRKSRTKNY